MTLERGEGFLVESDYDHGSTRWGLSFQEHDQAKQHLSNEWRRKLEEMIHALAEVNSNTRSAAFDF